MTELNFGLTIDSYKTIASAAANKYSSVVVGQDKLSDSSMIWRHDVDFSIAAARTIAEIDENYGIKANFFFRLGAETYNLLEKNNLNLLHEIHEMNHSVGLHFDPMPEDLISENHLNQGLSSSKLVFEKSTGLKIHSFSFHNTSDKSLRFNGDEYAGLANAYSTSYFDTNFYTSDSGGYWKYRPMIEMIRDNNVNKLQALTHPEWWLVEDTSPFAKINIAAKIQYQNALNKYLSDLQSFGLPLNRGEIDQFLPTIEQLNKPYEGIVFCINSRKFTEALLLVWYLANQNYSTKIQNCFQLLDEYLHLNNVKHTEIMTKFQNFVYSTSLQATSIRQLFTSEQEIEIAASFGLLLIKHLQQ